MAVFKKNDNLNKCQTSKIESTLAREIKLKSLKKLRLKQAPLVDPDFKMPKIDEQQFICLFKQHKMEKYNFKIIEKKWQEHWEKIKFLKPREKNKKKFYCLEMFPYPSGSTWVM